MYYAVVGIVTDVVLYCGKSVAMAGQALDPGTVWAKAELREDAIALAKTDAKWYRDEHPHYQDREAAA